MEMLCVSYYINNIFLMKEKIVSTENLPEITDEHCLKEFGWTKSRFEIIQRTYFKGLSYDEIAIFAHVCKHTQLDPFLKQIYPVKRKTKQKDGSYIETMTIQTGIDGYRAIAERTGNYSPGKEPLFKYDKDGRLFSATAYVMKMTKDGKWHEIAATAILKEYMPSYPNDFWNTKQHIMISKCAEALALRKAFTAELSGVYTKEEMDQADVPEKLPEADCEVKENVPSLNSTYKTSSQQIDTNLEHKKHDTNLIQEQKVSSDQHRQILEGMFQVDETFLSNYAEYMNSKWNAKSYQDLPERAFLPTMTAIKRNIEFNKQNTLAKDQKCQG